MTAMLLGRPTQYWIGLHVFENGEFYWADNSDVSFTNWAPGQPSGDQTVNISIFQDAHVCTLKQDICTMHYSDL